jgi:uncharacterized protein
MKPFFPLIVTLFFAMVHYLAYTRIVSHLHVRVSTKKALNYFLILNMIAIIGYLLSRYLLSPPKLLYFILSLSIGIGFILFMAILFYEFLHLIQRHTPFSEEKRAFFKRSSDLGFLALGSAYLGAALLEGSQEPVVNLSMLTNRALDQNPIASYKSAICISEDSSTEILCCQKRCR